MLTNGTCTVATYVHMHMHLYTRSYIQNCHTEIHFHSYIDTSVYTVTFVLLAGSNPHPSIINSVISAYPIGAAERCTTVKPSYNMTFDLVLHS